MRWLDNRKEIVLVGLLTAVVAGSVLAVGGVPPPVIVVFGFLSIFCGAWATFLFPPPRCSPAPVLLLISLAVYSAIQAIPIPISLLRHLSPSAADVWSRCLLPLGETVSMGSLSLDPGASVQEAIKWSSYAAIWYSSSVVASQGGTEKLFGVLFGASLLVGLSSLGHVLLGATTIWGVYTPLHGGSWVPGPLLNSNTLSEYMNLGALVGLGLFFRTTPILPRPVLGVGIVTLIAVSIRSASRGGIASLLVGLLIFGGTTYWTSRRGSSQVKPIRPMLALLTVALLIGIVLAITAADDFFWTQILSENRIKLAIPSWVKPMILDYRWFGVGRGAFESSFEAYRPANDQHLVFTHPENFVLQWTSEWGLPIGGSALLAFGWLLRPTNLGFGRSALITAGATGVAIVFLQNLVDLGSELFGLGTALALVLGALWGDSRRRGRRYRVRWPRANAVALRGSLVAGVSFLALALSMGLHPVDQDRLELRNLVAMRVRSPRDLYAEVRTRTLRHPADYYFPLVGAIVAQAAGDRPIPWLQRALERGPTIGRVHLMLAEVLAGYGIHAQALLELRLAAEYEPALARSASAVALRFTRRPEDLFVAIPDGPGGLAVLEAFAEGLYRPEDRETRELIDSEALGRDPSSMKPRGRLVDVRVESLKAGTALCEDRRRCISEVLEHADAFERYEPNSALAAMTRATIDIAEGNLKQADERLTEGCKAVDERPRCLRLHADVLGERNDPERLGAVLAAYAASSCTSHSSCADAHASVARFRMQRSEPQLALDSLEKAAKEDPTEARWMEVVLVAEQTRTYSVAVMALERVIALRREPDPDLVARKERLKQQMHEFRP